VAHFAKPEQGSWTELYPQLGTDPVNYDDSIDPQWFEDERDAVFRRSWLNVGRVEQLARTGSYFTKELDVLRTSVILVRDADLDRIIAGPDADGWSALDAAALRATDGLLASGEIDDASWATLAEHFDEAALLDFVFTVASSSSTSPTNPSSRCASTSVRSPPGSTVTRSTR